MIIVIDRFVTLQGGLEPTDVGDIGNTGTARNRILRSAISSHSSKIEAGPKRDNNNSRQPPSHQESPLTLPLLHLQSLFQHPPHSIRLVHIPRQDIRGRLGSTGSVFGVEVGEPVDLALGGAEAGDLEGDIGCGVEGDLVLDTDKVGWVSGMKRGLTLDLGLLVDGFAPVFGFLVVLLSEVVQDSGGLQYRACVGDQQYATST